MARLSTLVALAGLVPAWARLRAAPALQPSEVYDADFPTDMAKLTPQELRYKAQADYAKAIAVLKKEAAEAEAAQREMEKALKDYMDAEAAAKKAKFEAEDALKNKDRYSDESVDADTRAKKEAAEAATMKDALTHEKDDLANAVKSLEDAGKGKDAMQAKIAELKKKHEDLCGKIKALEAESAAMGHELNYNQKNLEGAKSAADAEKSRIDGTAMRAKTEAEEVEAAKRDAMSAQERYEAARKAAEGKGADQAAIDAEIAKQQGEYDTAAENYRKQATDVDEAQRRVDRAKAELAKYEQQPLSFGGASGKGFQAVLLLAPLLALH